MLRGFTVTRTNLLKDGITLVQASAYRYVESIFPVVKSIMDARKPLYPDPPVEVNPPVEANPPVEGIDWANQTPVSLTPIGHYY